MRGSPAASPALAKRVDAPGAIDPLDPNAEVPFAERLGECYPNAGAYVLENGGTLVHGSIEGMGQPRLNHAWVELPGGEEVFEPTTGHRMAMSEFEEWASPERDAKYDQKAMLFEMGDHQHWGPWEFKRTDSKRLDELLDFRNLPGRPDGVGTPDDPIAVGDDLDLAATLIADGKHIRLDRVDEVGSLLDKLTEIANDAKAKGEKAPTYNLCLVSVPGTNLFCRETRGTPRTMMPQLGGFPAPGSRADQLPRTDEGGVDAYDQFLDEMRARGVGIEDRTVPAYWLKATQNELNGVKVAKISHSMEKHGIMPGTKLFVTRDGYIIDGHHRWASMVAMDARNSELGDIQVDVAMIDMGIDECIPITREWANSYGILAAQVGSDKPVTSKGARKRVDSGYLVGGYFVERAPGNQWNIYPQDSYDPATGSAPYPDVVMEGARSLAEVDQWIANQSAQPPDLHGVIGLPAASQGRYDGKLPMDVAAVQYNNLRVPGNDHGLDGAYDALVKRFGKENVPPLGEILDYRLGHQFDWGAGRRQFPNENWADLSVEKGWKSSVAMSNTPVHEYAGVKGMVSLCPDTSFAKWPPDPAMTPAWSARFFEGPTTTNGRTPATATDTRTFVTLDEAKNWGETIAGPPEFDDWLMGPEGPAEDKTIGWTDRTWWKRWGDRKFLFIDGTEVYYRLPEGDFRAATQLTEEEYPKKKVRNFPTLDEAVAGVEKDAYAEGRLGVKGLGKKKAKPLDAIHVNPYWGSNEDYSINCQKCVAASEMRARGYDVTAAAGDGGPDNQMGFLTWFDLNPEEDIKTVTGGQNYDFYATNAKSLGPVGTRGSLSVAWNGEFEGHVFSWENTPKGVHFFDPQDGEEYPPDSHMWSNISPTYPNKIVRLSSPGDEKAWIGPTRAVFERTDELTPEERADVERRQKIATETAKEFNILTEQAHQLAAQHQDLKKRWEEIRLRLVELAFHAEANYPETEEEKAAAEQEFVDLGGEWADITGQIETLDGQMKEIARQMVQLQETIPTKEAAA